MIAEIIIVFLIIIMVIIFLLFFKSWYIHVTFKNYNLDYNLSLIVNYLIFQMTLTKQSLTTIIFNLNIFSHTIKIYELELKSNNNEDENSEKDSKSSHQTEHEEKQNINDKEQQLYKIKEICELLFASREDLYKIVILAMQIIKFKNSNVLMKLGLSDNNLTIKFCNLLWSLTSPLYPLHFYFTLTPQINTLNLESEANITLNMKLFNTLKILLIIVKNRNLINVIKKTRDFFI